MAQDPEDETPDESSVDTSSDLDMVDLYRSPTVGSEIEADIIRGILDSNGIPTLMSRAIGYPSLGFKVQVHRRNVREATRLIEEAQAAGPAAALDAEQAWEKERN
jgi:Putative prokaryotic signal transducing protein